MKIEIKNVKYSAFTSQETHCFQATVYVDGKKAFITGNDGHGGCDYYDSCKGGVENPHDKVNEIDEWLRNNTEGQWIDSKVHIHNSLEIIVGNLMNEWHRDNEVKKILKKISYLKGNSVYQQPARVKPTDKNLELVQQAAWWDKDNKLLNGMTVPEAKAELNKVGFFG